MNVRVGPAIPLATGQSANLAQSQMTRVANRWIDAIYLEHGAVNLVEAKLEPDPGIFSQLIHYARKFRADPGYAHLAGAPVNLIALVNRDDPSVREEAPFYGVRWEVYQPNLKELPPAAGAIMPSIGSDVELPQDWPARLQAWGIKASSS